MYPGIMLNYGHYRCMKGVLEVLTMVSPIVAYMLSKKHSFVVFTAI